MRIENRAPERNPRSVPVPSRSSALGNGDEARLLDRCAEGGASGIPDDHRSRQGDRVGGYLRLLKGKAESAPPAPHDGPGAGHHRPGAGRPLATRTKSASTSWPCPSGTRPRHCPYGEPNADVAGPHPSPDPNKERPVVGESTGRSTSQAAGSSRDVKREIGMMDGAFELAIHQVVLDSPTIKDIPTKQRLGPLQGSRLTSFCEAPRYLPRVMFDPTKIIGQEPFQRQAEPGSWPRARRLE